MRGILPLVSRPRTSEAVLLACGFARTGDALEVPAALPDGEVGFESGGELTVAGECLAAFRVALAKRIISFGWDESTKFGLGLLSSNTQIETPDGEPNSLIAKFPSPSEVNRDGANLYDMYEKEAKFFHLFKEKAYFVSIR